MGQPLYLIDAFVNDAFADEHSADKTFTGNPAGVCLLTEEKSPHWMQQVAAEINQAETAFLRKRPDGDWDLRWFTPAVEVNLCGHATLASAHALWQHVGESNPTLAFHTHSGVLKARRVGTGAEAGICLDFPDDPPTAIDAVPAALVTLLGGQPRWFGEGRDDVIAVVDSADQVRQLRPDNELIASFTRRGLIVTAPGDTDSLDMVSRFFAPNAGIPEDAVTGSAHCLLAAYWGERLGKTHLRALQASARTGLLTLDWACESDGNGGQKAGRVYLTGATRTRLTGEFHD